MESDSSALPSAVAAQKNTARPDSMHQPAAGGTEGQQALIQFLGSLMDASHESCRSDYECSSSELHELVRAMKDAGALGARLTGAQGGWMRSGAGTHVRNNMSHGEGPV